MGGDLIDLDNSESVHRIMAERKASVRNVETNAADYVRISCPQCGKPEHGTTSCETAPGWDAPYELTVYPGPPPKPSLPPDWSYRSPTFPRVRTRLYRRADGGGPVRVLVPTWWGRLVYLWEWWWGR